MTEDRRQELVQALPYARRFARALTRNQAAGDALVAGGLKDYMAESAIETVPRLGLYRAIYRRFSTQNATDEQTLGTRDRALLLLTSLEDQSVAAAAIVIGLDETTAVERLQEARKAVMSVAAANVLIIEDEPIIAMDIQNVVEECGHRVVAVAQTKADAVALAEKLRPSLILADINLGAGGDGTHAVARILRSHKVPVIFVTAYPERLLTGEVEEPSFVVTKPFEPLTLAIATYQAFTGGVPSL
ncbi:response regulator [Brytella acorum]|uniref:Response regulator n=1 Tax=Brytella acorum TaxID=2959299 RepID=A0AA35V8J1_9PROT|nr:response regulator [Brytella acorum]MDF3624391.1 response regulator [Brytella acorum]CAI9119759.1 response regulator [Brytella acorum]